MTINLADNTPRVSYAVAEGVTQTSFTVSFEFFDDADLNVYVDGTLKTLTTDYTVSGGDGSTGTVSISVTGASGGSTVVITRDIALERTTDFPASGAFQIGSLNTELDRLTAIASDLDDKASRSLQLTDYDTAVSLVLPDVDTRKGKTLAFNATTGAVESGPSISDVQAVSAASADIATLADIEDGTDATDAIQTVAGISANVTTVAGISSNVTTVAGVTTDLANVTANLTDIQNASTNATNAAASATAAATSETNAATSETNAASSASSASTSATAAASSATSASTSATNAATSETNAASSATSASTSASTATTKASEASTSASNASTSETNAATSATNAATSATNASSSASSAAASATAAASSAAAAATTFDNFDDTYLGAFASNPTVDNDGDPLNAGDLHFNTTANEMRVYDGSQWIAASAAQQVSFVLFEYTATASQTTFSGADDNAATLSYTAGNIQVMLNGVVLDPSDYTATNGTSVVLASGAALNDVLNIYAFTSFTVADTVSASTGGTFSANVAITGDLTVDTNTLYVDSTNNRVGIGTASPSAVAIHAVNSGSMADGIILESQGVGDSEIEFRNTSSGNHTWAVGLDQSNSSAFSIAYANVAGASLTSNNKLTIDTSGNVGIGTSSPNNYSNYTTLTLNNTNGGEIDFEKAGTVNGSLFTPSGTSDFQVTAANASGNLIFSAGGYAEKMRIDSSGRVMMGQTSAAPGYAQLNTATINGVSLSTNHTTDYYPAAFYHNGTLRGYIYTTSTSTSYSTSSDYRLKENVTADWDATTRLKQLNPVRFNFIADADTTVDGFLAHEVQDIVPEAVTGTKDAMRDEEYEVTPATGDIYTAAIPATFDEDGNEITAAVDEVVHSSDVERPETLADGQQWRETTPAVMGTRSVPDYQGIDQSKLVPLLVKTIQELEARITALENA